MTVSELEQAVYEREQIRIVVRADRSEQVGDYEYQRCAPSTTSVAEFTRQRLQPLIGDFEIMIVNGSGQAPHGRTRLATLRDSYVS